MTNRAEPNPMQGVGFLVGASLALGIILALPTRGASATESPDQAVAADTVPTDAVDIVAAPALQLAQTEYQRRLSAGLRPHLHRIGRALSVSSIDPHSGRVDTSLFLDQGDNTLVSHHLSHASLEPATEAEFEPMAGAIGHAQHHEELSHGRTRRFISYIAPTTATTAATHHQERLVAAGYTRAPDTADSAGRARWIRGDKHVDLLITGVPSTSGAASSSSSSSITLIIEGRAGETQQAAASPMP